MQTFSVIFDVDGVLIDSVGLNWQAYNKALEKHGINVPDDKISRYVGRVLSDQIAMINADYNSNIDPVKFENETKEIKKDLFLKIEPKPGVLRLLNELKFARIPLAIATSLSREVAVSRLESAGILNYFDVLTTEEDVTNHKPSPEIYIQAANYLKEDLSRCIVFEDAPSGIESAKSAGMKCIAVKTPYVAKEKLTIADRVVASLEEVNLSMIEKINGLK